MRLSACWHAAMISLFHTSGESRHAHPARAAPSPTAVATPTPIRAAMAFIPSLGPHPSSPPPTAASRISLAATPPRLHHRRRACTRKTQRAPALATTGMAMKMSEIARPGADNNNDGGASGITLWLDMRTTVLPAAQTLKTLYGELRQREEALGRSPGDPDWTLSRVPNPVGALFYAAEPVERAAEEMKALGSGGGGGGGGSALPCFRLSNIDDTRIVDVSSGDVAGVGVDPAGDGGGGAGNSAATDIVAAVQRAGGGRLVLLRGLRPSVWEGGDMGTVLQIASSACGGAGKTLVVTVRSVGQLHDAAMAAFAASQTQVLGSGTAEGGKGTGGGGASPMALLIEPLPELWEAGLLYL